MSSTQQATEAKCYVQYDKTGRDNFSKRLPEGKTGETLIAQFLRSRGAHVLPVYEIAENQFKGPCLYAANGETVIAPDMLVFSGKGILFVEAKHKKAFTWYRKKQQFETGIDKHHYEQYLVLQDTLHIPVWLLFLHRGGIAKDSPESPSGLFGNSLDYLEKHISHNSDNWGKYGMVYWCIDDLKKLGDYAEIKTLEKFN
jgi:hypothetical protein